MGWICARILDLASKGDRNSCSVRRAVRSGSMTPMEPGIVGSVGDLLRVGLAPIEAAQDVCWPIYAACDQRRLG